MMKTVVQLKFFSFQSRMIFGKYCIDPMKFESIGQPSPFEKSVTMIFISFMKALFVPLFQDHLTKKAYGKFFQLMLDFVPRWNVIRRKIRFPESGIMGSEYLQRRAREFKRLINSCGNSYGNTENNHLMIFLQQTFCNLLQTYCLAGNMKYYEEYSVGMLEYAKKVLKQKFVYKFRSLFEEKLLFNLFDHQEKDLRVIQTQRLQQTLIRDRNGASNNAIENEEEGRVLMRGQQNSDLRGESVISDDGLLNLDEFFNRLFEDDFVNQRSPDEMWMEDLVNEEGDILYETGNRLRNMMNPYVPRQLQLDESDEVQRSQIFDEPSAFQSSNEQGLLDLREEGYPDFSFGSQSSIEEISSNSSDN